VEQNSPIRFTCRFIIVSSFETDSIVHIYVIIVIVYNNDMRGCNFKRFSPQCLKFFNSQTSSNPSCPAALCNPEWGYGNYPPIEEQQYVCLFVCLFIGVVVLVTFVMFVLW
jgi:hypothetical protein